MKLLSRTLTMIICFQLAYGCGGGGSSSTKAGLFGGKEISISGTLAQAIGTVGDIVFPSAMAAKNVSCTDVIVAGDSGNLYLKKISMDKDVLMSVVSNMMSGNGAGNQKNGGAALSGEMSGGLFGSFGSGGEIISIEDFPSIVVTEIPISNGSFNLKVFTPSLIAEENEILFLEYVPVDCSSEKTRRFLISSEISKDVINLKLDYMNSIQNDLGIKGVLLSKALKVMVEAQVEAIPEDQEVPAEAQQMLTAMKAISSALAKISKKLPSLKTPKDLKIKKKVVDEDGYDIYDENGDPILEVVGTISALEVVRDIPKFIESKSGEEVSIPNGILYLYVLLSQVNEEDGLKSIGFKSFLKEIFKVMAESQEEAPSMTEEELDMMLEQTLQQMSEPLTDMLDQVIMGYVEAKEQLEQQQEQMTLQAMDNFVGFIQDDIYQNLDEAFPWDDNEGAYIGATYNSVDQFLKNYNKDHLSLFLSEYPEASLLPDFLERALEVRTYAMDMVYPEVFFGDYFELLSYDEDWNPDYSSLPSEIGSSAIESAERSLVFLRKYAPVDDGNLSYYPKYIYADDGSNFEYMEDQINEMKAMFGIE